MLLILMEYAGTVWCSLVYVFTDVYIGMQAVVGVAGGATRAALTQHQARRNNMADVSAKDGSQVCWDKASELY